MKRLKLIILIILALFFICFFLLMMFIDARGKKVKEIHLKNKKSLDQILQKSTTGDLFILYDNNNRLPIYIKGIRMSYASHVGFIYRPSHDIDSLQIKKKELYLIEMTRSKQYRCVRLEDRIQKLLNKQERCIIRSLENPLTHIDQENFDSYVSQIKFNTRPTSTLLTIQNCVKRHIFNEKNIPIPNQYNNFICTDQMITLLIKANILETESMLCLGCLQPNFFSTQEKEISWENMDINDYVSKKYKYENQDYLITQ